MKSAEAFTADLFADLPPVADPVPEPPARGSADSGNDSYFNTTKETGDQLASYRHKAKGQEAVIMKFFLEHPGRLFTPSQLNPLLPRAPLTSVRRAISDLTTAGVLVKTAQKRPGLFGRPELHWKLNPNYRGGME